MNAAVPSWQIRLLGLALAGCTPSGRDASPTGEALFSGALPLVAHLQGDDLDLPTIASRCSNCHLMAAPADVGGPDARLGPMLTPALLTAPQKRRGGPPSRYDATNFCTLLRTGVDPASVVVRRTMPRYRLDDAGCRALWDYLVRP